jgi:outer membrane receptor for ferric coprogen and ferric-rhodotorulic acid
MSAARPDSFRPSVRAIRAALLGMALASVAAAGTHALAADAPALVDSTPKAYNLPAAPLGRTLSGVASGAGLALSFDPSLTEGLTSPALQGSYPVREAMTRLLAGSGLQMVPRTDGSYTLRKQEAGAAGATGAAAATGATLGAVTVTAQAERNATTEGTGAYVARAVTLAKGDVALKDIPQSISVVTRQRMDDQNLTSLADVVGNTTGLVATQGMGPGIAVTSRGFLIDTMQYDGVAVPRNTYSLGNWGSETLVFYDRVEVLRGAAGLLQGAGSPGGTINFVRKRGQAEPTITLTGKAGSWDHYGAQLDAGGPLNAEGSLRGRLVLDEDKTHSFIDSVWSRTTSVYGALDYDISAQTTVGLGVSNKTTEGRPSFIGLPRYSDGSDIGLPRSTYTGADWNRANNDQTSVYADLEHRFNDRWTLKASALGMNEKNSSMHQRMAGTIAPDGSGSMYGDFATNLAGEQRAFDVYLRGGFEALGLSHDIVVGANYSKYTTDDAFARAWTMGANIFNINHNRPEPTYASIAARGFDTQSNYDTEQKGVYGTWRTKLTERLTGIVGARVSWYDQSYSLVGSDSPSIASASGKVTPYVGLVYALNKQWSTYASYSDVFEPQSVKTVAGTALPPIEGSNIELGLKGELLDGRVNASFAVFRYDHKNRATTDFDSGYACDGWYCSSPSGKVRSQGFETEVSGEVLRGLQLTAGYTYNTTKYLEDPELKGETFSTWTPKHLARIWADYKLQGDWSRLSVGGGVNVQSKAGSYDRLFDVPGFAVWGARAAYQVTPTTSIAVNINNLFDKRYYIASYNGIDGSNYYGDPRNVMFTVKYTPKF